MKLLVINSGSTSTKLAVYEDDNQIWAEGINHPAEEISHFSHVNEQYEFRKHLIIEEIRKAGFEIAFDAVIGRGGLLKPTKGGVYLIDDKIKYDLINSHLEHASNLAALIADDIARYCGCPAYIADPVVTDELCDEARFTGIPEIKRISVFHALNSRAEARRYAKSCGRRYEDMNFVVAHMGGGISVSAHRYGRVTDVNNAINGDGPFSPERAGTVPAGQLVDLCFSGKYSYDEISKMLNGRGGMVAYLGTTSGKDVALEIEKGNEEYKKVFDAMIYTIGKQIGCMHVALKCKTDAIILTGGLAHNKYLVSKLKEWIEPLANVVVAPGEDELGALALNALAALKGEIELQVYNPD